MRNLILFVALVGCSSLAFNGCSDSSSKKKKTSQFTPLTALGWQGSRGIVGVPFARQFPAAGGQPPYAWSLPSGAPPPGLTLDPTTGQLQGTPSQAGSFTYTYQVVDQAGDTSTQSTTQTIDATGAPPTFKISAPTGLPTFTGTTFAFQPFMEGGSLPITWAYSLPPNFQFNQSSGAISGTLTTNGSFTADATASDSTGAQATPITYTFGVDIGGAGVSQPPGTAFDGIWDVTYNGPIQDTATSVTQTANNALTGFSITNGVVNPSGTVNAALNTISNVDIQVTGLGVPIRLGGSITSGGTASGTWAPLASSGWVATGGNTWTATRR